MAPGDVPLPLTGIMIAIAASFINGSTFVLQRKGILRSREKGRSYLTDVVWWTGTLFSEFGNFLAYNIAPAVIVTPLGALGVFFGALLASWILKEHLNLLGKLGCVLCCSGSVVLIIHAPKAEAVMSRIEFEQRLLDPVFVTYILLVLLLLLLLIVRIAPAHGSSNIMVYICICSLLGSFTVPSSKGLGLVAKDVFAGEPPSGRALALFLALLAVLAGSIVTQFIFINRALERFSPNTFEAIYYVTFTSSVILASALLFKEWTALDVNDSLAIICSLATMCVGVILLRLSQQALITWRKKTD